jgi:subtilase family serine protease
MRFWKLVLPLLASTLCLAATPDRITSPIDASQMVALTGNVHGLAQSRYDLGRADGGKVIHGVTLAFRPSPVQQQALNTLLAQQQDRLSANFHKWLTPAQFADRFGMTQSDINRIVTWLQSQGLTVTSIANSRNQISFEGTVAQIESVFSTEIHDYLVDGEIHFANATNPSVPAAIASSVLSVGHLHNFQPKPHAIIQRLPSIEVDPHFTSHISGNHFVAPGDFATIYQVDPLYTAGMDGTGQKIITTGQSLINLSDVANFRSAAGLAANVPTLLLMPNTGTSTRCSGDEGESDLDVEWSGAVAKNASITLVYAGLESGDTCANRQFGAFDALQYAIDQNLAPIISNSYGNCESAVGNSFVLTMQGWIQEANTQGQTVMSASGDSGAADCDFQVTSATLGLAVDIPAAIPEVTGMGGTEFNGDAEATVTNGNAAATQYWSGTTGGTDTISSVLSYIPEMGWNDTANSNNTGGDILGSGGGASIYFAKPTWQTGTGVPNDNKRDVPDLALNASPFHDPYLFCSEDGASGTIVATCTNGFRTGSGGDLTAVGGTSAAAPTFAGILALINQYLITNNLQPPSGTGNANPNLYYIAANNPTAMNDVTSGSNIVPCTEGTTGCPSVAPFQYGFEAGVGYDQVTGLGSVNANALAIAWGELSTLSTTSISSSTNAIIEGNNVTLTATVTPASTTGSVSFYSNLSSTALGTVSLSNGGASLTTAALTGGANSVVGEYHGINAPSTSAAVNIAVTPPYTLTPSPASLSVAAGASAATVITITPTTGFTGGTVSFTNSTASSVGSCTAGLPAGAQCSFNPNNVTVTGTSTSAVTMTITTAPTMAIPNGAQTVTVTSTGSGSVSVSTTVGLTVSKTTESFALATTGAATFPVPVGGTASVQLTVNGSNGFITGSGAGAATVSPLTYTCTGVPSLSTAEISCQLPNNGQPDSATAVTVSLVTTPVTTKLIRPTMGGGSRIFYALLLPGLFGIVFAAGSRGRMRLLSLIVGLGCSTLWLGACGGSSSNNNTLKNSGTPAGSYVVTISATTGGASPLMNTNAPFTITLQVQ